MARFVTDQTIAGLPVMQGLDETGRAEVVGDAAAVYAHVAANEWIDEAQLRRWGETVGVLPDRMNRALAFLDQSCQLARMPAAKPPAEPTDPDDEGSGSGSGVGGSGSGSGGELP